jgi:hypothetical protein
MIGNISVRTGAGAEPISLAEAKLHCRVDSDITADDPLITGLIAAARAHVENVTSRYLVTQGLRATFPHFPGCAMASALYNSADSYDAGHIGRVSRVFQLRAPLRRVDSITYLDAANGSNLLDAATYNVDPYELPGIVSLAYQKTWPVILFNHPAAVTVNFTVGYATPFTADATANTLTAPGHPYVTGDVVRMYNSGGALPAGLAANTDYYALGVSGNTMQLAATAGGAAIDITGAGTGTHFLGVVPVEIRQAMLLMIAHWYENREAVIVGTRIIVADNKMAVDMLLAPLRVMGF